jgi:hypothetical protein
MSIYENIITEYNPNDKEYEENNMMYKNDTRLHFLEDESYNQDTELCLMTQEDKINENYLLYIHNQKL